MRIFYGWVIVAVGIVVTCLGFGSMMSLGVFMPAISDDMGWSRTGVSATSMLNFLSLGLATFAWGALSDRYGPRAVVFAGGALLGLGLAAASQAAELWQFQLLFGLSVGIAAGSSYAPLIAATTRWFTQNRSLAIALVSLGLGVGAVVMSPLAGWLIDGYGWRAAMLTLGVIVWIVALPAALLVRSPPAEPASAAGAASGEFSFAEAARTPQFAAIALTHFACCAAHSGPIFHMVSYAMSCGVPALTAATVYGAAGFGGLFGRVIGGLLSDRLGVKRVLVAGLVIQAVSIGLYLFAHDLASLYALSLLFGFSYGGVMPLYAILVRQYFGARTMGATFGAVTMVSTLGMAIGPLVGGWVFDAFTGYGWLYVGASAIGLGAVAIGLTFRPPRALTLAPAAA